MAEPGRNGNSGGSKGSSLAVFLFIMGLLAVGVTIVFSGIRNMPKSVMLSEGVVMLCLLGLLIFAVSARRRGGASGERDERQPYGGIDKQSIEDIFAAISEEEKKRERLDAFASGADLKAVSAAQRAAEAKENGDPAEETPAAAEEEKPAGENTEEMSTDKPEAAEGEKPADAAKRPANGQRPPQAGKAPGKGAPQGPQRSGQPKKKRPYDPYYEDRYDRYGNPVRRRPPEVLYDEHGNPVRRRPPEVYYDEYGRPVRRRDPYAQGGRPPQKRRPDGTPVPPKKRPAGAAAGAAAAAGAKGLPPEAPARRKRPGGSEAPVGMAGLKEQSRYSDEYVAVAIEDDYEDTYVPAPRNAKGGPRGAAAYYDDEEVDRSAPVVVPDDDYDPGYEDDAARNAPKPRPAPQQDYDKNYRPSYDDEEAVVVVPEFDDEPDDGYAYAPPQRPQPQRRAPQPAPEQRAAQRAPAYDEPYVPDYEEEDVVTVLPRDEEYDSYMEKKRAEERRAERRKTGKTALTIQKMRRKKIRRSSRKYKNFRCSVHKLTDYLNAYSKKVRSKP